MALVVAWTIQVVSRVPGDTPWSAVVGEVLGRILGSLLSPIGLLFILVGPTLAARLTKWLNDRFDPEVAPYLAWGFVSLLVFSVYAGVAWFFGASAPLTGAILRTATIVTAAALSPRLWRYIWPGAADPVDT